MRLLRVVLPSAAVIVGLASAAAAKDKSSPPARKGMCRGNRQRQHNLRV